MASPVTHNTTAKPMVASMMRSSRLIGPIFSNRSAAALGASGVSLISGGDNCSHSTRCSCQSKRHVCVSHVKVTLCHYLCCDCFRAYDVDTCVTELQDPIVLGDDLLQACRLSIVVRILPVRPHSWSLPCRSSCTCCQDTGKGVAAWGPCWGSRGPCWGTALYLRHMKTDP